MPFGTHTHLTFRILFLTILVIAGPLVALATPTEEDLSGAKEEFSELWSAAEEATKRRAVLEARLVGVASRVELARVDIEKASKEQKIIGAEILKKRALINLLREQLQELEQAQAFYYALGYSQKHAFSKFVRTMASRGITETDTGPVVGGEFLRRIFRGSLGEGVDDDLNRMALLKARKRFLGQVNVLVKESVQAEDRIRDVAEELAAEIESLEARHAAASTTIDEKVELIDTTWKQRELTHDEIEHVAQESAEASAMMAAAQMELVRVNEELKEAKKKGIVEELNALKKTLQGYEAEKIALLRRDHAMQILEKGALEALDAAIAAKNSDKKLYKKIEQRIFELTSKKKERDAGRKAAALGTEPTEPLPDSLKLDRDIRFLEEGIALMKEGYPDAEAFEVVRTRNEAAVAKVERQSIQAKMKEIHAKLASQNTLVSQKVAEIEKVEKAFATGDLGSLFVWPVRGPITAGFYDADYEKVFRVPHRAIDIAVPQLTPVRSITEGIIVSIKDGGAKGYSYVLVGHQNGYASLYGHVSKVLVKTGDIVKAGQVIALSGGKPGTPGAGYMTTGAHLHLEVTKDGKHTNPWNVLSGK